MELEGKELSFEQAMTELEEILNKLENAKPGLESSIALYTRGMELSRLCDELLSDAQLKIESLE